MLNATEYLPKDFFAMLTSELCDKTDDRKMRRRRYNILLILRDTIDSGKFHMGNINGITNKNMQMAYARGCGTGQQSKHSRKCSIK